MSIITPLVISTSRQLVSIFYECVMQQRVDVDIVSAELHWQPAFGIAAYELIDAGATFAKGDVANTSRTARKAALRDAMEAVDFEGSGEYTAGHIHEVGDGMPQHETEALEAERKAVRDTSSTEAAVDAFVSFSADAGGEGGKFAQQVLDRISTPMQQDLHCDTRHDHDLNNELEMQFEEWQKNFVDAVDAPARLDSDNPRFQQPEHVTS